LVWPGKYNEDGTLREVPRVSLPFQVIETINESHASREAKKLPQQTTLFDVYEGKEGDTFEAGWRNKLIWGDNLLVMGSLLAKFAGKIDLIYIDPPFATGADFSMIAEIGEGSLEVEKEQSAIEERAYRDTWGRGLDSYMSMMRDRLVLLRDLLSDKGTIYVHCGYRVNSLLRLAMDEIFGSEHFRNEVIWTYSGGAVPVDDFPRKHDTLLKYRRGDKHTFNVQYRPYNELTAKRMQSIHKGVMVDVERGTPITDWWTDIKVPTGPANKEKIGYPTQKPEVSLTTGCGPL
jgi:adenine specific DNA methylase Mod